MIKIHEDENHNFQFDFSMANDVIILNQLTHCIPELQYNVDFILVEEKDIIFFEFKDSKIKNVNDEKKFEEKLTEGRDTFCKNMAKKFVSSLFWLWACKGNEEEKKISYCLLIENDFMDAKMRKLFRNKISRQLPHGYKSYENVKREILSDFSVVNLKEWKDKFPQYPIMQKH